MLARMVSITQPHDRPALASQSAGITGVSHYAWLEATFEVLPSRHYFIHSVFSLTNSHKCSGENLSYWNKVR